MCIQTFNKCHADRFRIHLISVKGSGRICDLVDNDACPSILRDMRFYRSESSRGYNHVVPGMNSAFNLK